MADRVSKLPRGKKKIPIDVIRTRLRDHLDLVLASINEALFRMIELFFSEIIDRLVQERPKAEVVPIKRETLKNDE
jgi:N-dimethylarginine dimethylaminohydrolase